MTVFRPVKNGKKSKYYYVKFRYKGKQVSKSTKKTVEAEALKWAKNYLKPFSNDDEEMMLKTAQKLVTKANKAKLKDALAIFNKQAREDISVKREKTIQSVWEDFTEFCKKEHNVIYLHEINHTVCSEYLGLIRKSGRYVKTKTYRRNNTQKEILTANPKSNLNRKLSQRTCNEYHKHLKLICNFLVDSDNLNKNYFHQIKFLKIINKDTREAFTQAELKLIIERADNYLLPIVIIGANTGLRKGDICTLEWREVDLINGWITRETRKTKKTVEIPILPALDYLLKGLTKKGKYVLPKHAETYLESPDIIGRKFKRFLEDELGITTTKNIGKRTLKTSIKDIHSLRHTFVWLAALEGTPLPVIQKIIGHMTPDMTEHYSRHATKKDIKEQLHIPNYLSLPEPEQLQNEDEYNLLQIKMIQSRMISPAQKMNEIRALLSNDVIDVKVN